MTNRNKIVLGIFIFLTTILATGTLVNRGKVPIDRYNNIRDSLIVREMTVDTLNMRFKRLSDTLGITLSQLDKSRLEAKLERINLIKEFSAIRREIEQDYIPISDSDLLNRITNTRDSLISIGEDVKYRK